MDERQDSSGCKFEPLLDSQEVAKLMGLHLETVKRRARTGEIPGIKLGQVWRFRAFALGTYIEETMLRRG